MMGRKTLTFVSFFIDKYTDYITIDFQQFSIHWLGYEMKK
jgi:hypothetical protein